MWAETRGRVGCDQIDPGEALIWVAPQALVSSACGRPGGGTLACVTGSYHRRPSLTGTRIRVSWDTGWSWHHRLVQHEAAHVLLGCTIGHQDGSHTLDAMWVDALGEAGRRFGEAHPAPPEADDPYSIPGPPWDLSATPWAGREYKINPAGLRPEACGMDGGTP